MNRHKFVLLTDRENRWCRLWRRQLREPSSSEGTRTGRAPNDTVAKLAALPVL